MQMEEKTTRTAVLKKAAAEMLGTFAMVFAGCGAIMVHGLYPATLPAGAIPVVFGLVVAAMVYALGHVSGAHLNPAVTIAFAAAFTYELIRCEPKKDRKHVKGCC